MVTHSRCFDCQREAPKADSDYTLIGSGWRLVERPSKDGSRSVTFRCPECWAKYKARNGLSSTGSWRGLVVPPGDCDAVSAVDADDPLESARPSEPARAPDSKKKPQK
jgi:hypothetical protein